jgi:hypothetical protein
MSKMLNPVTFATAGFAIAAGFTLFAFAGQAEAATKRFCEATSPKRTMACCEAYLRKSLDNRGNSGLISCNASTAIACKQSPNTSITHVGGGSGRVCYVVPRKKPNDHESKTHDGIQTHSAPNNPQGGGSAAAGNTKP